MKKIFTSLFLLAGLFTFTGCDSDDDITSVTIKTSLEQNYNISVAETGPTTISTTRTFDAELDPEVAKFGDRIDSYKLDSITLEFSSYVGAPDIDLTAAAFMIKATDGTELVAFTLVPTTGYQSINIKEFDDKNVRITVTLDDNSVGRIADALLEDNEIDLLFSATVDGQPAQFTLETKMYLQVTGSLL